MSDNQEETEVVNTTSTDNAIIEAEKFKEAANEHFKSINIILNNSQLTYHYYNP